MQTLTYTNTFINLEGKEEQITRQVLVNNWMDARELVAQWNENSKNHCKGRYRYHVKDTSPATKRQQETLDLY